MVAGLFYDGMGSDEKVEGFAVLVHEAGLDLIDLEDGLESYQSE